ncbi:MAG TPA: heterodisulfide reductase-related iron-sulfur binding cluster [Microlunatus sp.]|nr:heterodisulfide reductase-related iron-sulfur binding cluster [Microlunatus sp.]
MQVVAIVVSLAITAVAVVLAVRAVRSMLSVIRLGRPAVGRSDRRGERWKGLVTETLGHTRMLQWRRVGFLHWFVMIGFITLSSLVATAYGQLFVPTFALPIIGHWIVFEWWADIFSWLTLIGIVGLIVIRQRNHPRTEGRRSRFFGSTFWQAYFVEAVILGVVVCGLILRGLEYAHGNGTKWDFPLTWFIGVPFAGLSTATLDNLVFAVAMVKIIISMTWVIVIARHVTMGVAWHRFSAWFNIWFKRDPGTTSLGRLDPIMVEGKPLDFEQLEDLDEDAALGVGKIEDFTWKGLLDFTSCTECGRCQSQCPAWATDKPLSPKLLIMGLRDHAYTKAPYLQAAEEARGALPEATVKEADRPLIGTAELFGVIDPDVLWSCTSCGACVQQCPVDIEHVDHIMDMRRHQVLLESDFPSELNGLYKGLENKGNPWNMAPSKRMEWAKELPFEVKQVGVDVEDLTEVEWLFWVGCAGAYEDRAKKTTQAVAELLHMAGVDFAVLGKGETCTGDPARRSGNEFVFAGLATENAETLKEAKATKVVATCAHCFNTLKNEYAQFGVELEVVHHTQLLNRLVKDGRLKPVAPDVVDDTATKKITYHDPCFLGRHNQVYSPPRELLSVIPNTTFEEMPRNSERSFCCGAGGGRMWMEEKLGERINVNRTKEAVATGADQIAVGCPFCRVMLSDGLTAEQHAGEAREEVEVLDVAQLLLTSVKRGETP